MMNEVMWDQMEHSLKVGAPIRFSGNDREIAQAFILCCQILSEKTLGGGQIAIDYEQAQMPRSSDVGPGFGGWLEAALPVLLELKDISQRVCKNCPEEDVEAWVLRRRIPGRPALEVAAEMGVSTRWLRAKVAFMDRILAGELRRRGYIVRGI